MDQVAAFLLKMLLDYWTAVEALAESALAGRYLAASAVRDLLGGRPDAPRRVSRDA